MPKRSTFKFPNLKGEELELYNLINDGNVEEVRQFLGVHKNININCVDHTGMTPLTMSILGGNLEIVRLLLMHSDVKLGEGLMFAIKEDRIAIVKEVLDALAAKSAALEYMPLGGDSWSIHFEDDVTPLVLAARLGRTAAVSLLLERGHTIPRPHWPTCFCKEMCQPLLKDQNQLKLLLGRLHIYEALSHPSYICLTSEDPILTAFSLARELHQVSEIDSILKKNYKELAMRTRLLAANLVGECRNTEEVKVLLSEPSGYTGIRDAVPYPRLLLAMSLQQKEFVSHPNVQQVIQTTWTGDWYEWRHYSKLKRVILTVPVRLVQLPFIIFVLLFMPKSKRANHYALPVNKMLNELASYIVFLCFVFLQNTESKVGQVKTAKFTVVEYVLMLYVTSYICNGIRFCYVRTPREYFKRKWNWVECSMNISFALTFLFRAMSIISAKLNEDEGLERKYWSKYDPQLIAEGLLVISTILAFMRLLYVLQTDYDIGPFQISLGKMCHDCAKFSTMITVIMLAFTVGLSNFYSYYTGMAQINPDGTITKQGDSWTDILSTFKILFWGLFGMGDYSVSDVIIENLPDENDQLSQINTHVLTEWFGYIAFGVYMVLCVIVILNMLIAAMANTFQGVTDNVYTEWLFGRTEVYLQYTNHTALPNPFNLIPTHYSTWHSCSRPEIKNIEDSLIKGGKEHIFYKDVMNLIIQRYLKVK